MGAEGVADLPLIAHLRVGSRDLVGWTVFFVTTVAALAVNLGYHN
ncbi:hypothetical protein [Streptomyces sp. NPDC048825]